MQCPICGSDRKTEYTKCPTCGVDFSKWVDKVIQKLNKKTQAVVNKSNKSIKPNKPDESNTTSKSEPGRYKEIIKQE